MLRPAGRDGGLAGTGRTEFRRNGRDVQNGADEIAATAGPTTRDYGGHVVAALYGELDIVDAAGVMAMLAAAGARNPRIIVDLAALEYIDCSSLVALARVRAQARQAGGDLLIAAPRRPVRRLLELTGLIGIFSVHASVDEAVLAAGEAPAP